MRKLRALTYTATQPYAVAQAIAQLGANIAIARKRRRISTEKLARNAGISRPTLKAIESGSVGTGIGAYVAVLWALGIHGDIVRVAAPDTDREGMVLESARSPQRIRKQLGRGDDF